MPGLTQTFVDLVLQVVRPRLDPLAHYPAEVVTMNDDGTCEVRPDNVKRWGKGFSRVPIRGLPGVAVKVQPGARVLLCFLEGDVRRPIVADWEAHSLSEITVTAATKIVLKAPSVIAAEVEADARPVARAGDLVKVTFVMTAPGSVLEAVGYIMGNGSSKFQAE